MKASIFSLVSLLVAASSAVRPGTPVPPALKLSEAEAAAARLTIQASAGELARQVVLAVMPSAAGGSR